jgi:tetratricopeptide (TPR) repeat protein
MVFRYFWALCFAAAALGQAVPNNANPPAADTKTAGDAASDSLAVAQALLNGAKAGEAATAFKAIVEKNPASAEAQAGLVRSLLRSHKVDEADEAAKKALAAVPASALVHAAAGDVDFREGKFGEAEAEYRSALKIDSTSARATFGVARIMDMVSMHRSAKAALAKAHELDPQDRQIYEYWLDSLPYAEALEAVKKGAGDHPSEREQEEIKFLAAAAQKKPWTLATEMKPTEIKLQKYGRGLARVFTGNSAGARPVAQGYALDVRFNDRVTASLLLDTGAGGIVLGRKLAEKAGVVKIANTYLGGIGDKGPVQGYVGRVDKIEIGGVEFHDCTVIVSSQSDIVDESGLIGADVFKRFLVTLDFKEFKLLLSPLPRNPNSSGSQDDPQDRYIATEMQGYTKVYSFGHDLVIPVLVSDKASGNFILDTGASMNNISTKLANVITKLSYEGYSLKGVSGSVEEVLNGDKAILQFAKVRVRSDDIPAIDFDHTSNSEGSEIGGLIGIRTLTQMKMTIDYRDGLVNFEVYDFKKARE